MRCLSLEMEFDSTPTAVQGVEAAGGDTWGVLGGDGTARVPVLLILVDEAPSYLVPILTALPYVPSGSCSSPPPTSRLPISDLPTCCSFPHLGNVNNFEGSANPWITQIIPLCFNGRISQIVCM